MKFQMKKTLWLSFLLLTLPMAYASQGNQSAKSKPMSEHRIPSETLAKIAFGSSILGLVFIAIPALSLLGLVLGILGFGLGIFTRKKVKKKLFSRLAIILGSVVLFYFTLALGLVIFY